MSHTAYFYADSEKPYVTTVSVRLQLLLLEDIPENKASGVTQKSRLNRQNFSSDTDLTSQINPHDETTYMLPHHIYR